MKVADPGEVAEAGYAYVYMDDDWWDRLPEARQLEYLQGCPTLVGAQRARETQHRWLWDVRSCSGGGLGSP